MGREPQNTPAEEVASLRQSLEEARREAADWKLLLRAVMRNSPREDGAAASTNGIGWFWRTSREDSWTPMDLGADGLPALPFSAPTRAALGGTET